MKTGLYEAFSVVENDPCRKLDAMRVSVTGRAANPNLVSTVFEQEIAITSVTSVCRVQEHVFCQQFMQRKAYRNVVNWQKIKAHLTNSNFEH